MRFDILDEYSTLVPFGLGISKQNRVVQYPAAATKAVKPCAVANCDGRLKILFKFVKALGQFRGRKAAC
ncbi:MAG: hypothetical protein AB7S71_00160 [Dongiaceae bacterium]